MNSNIIYIYIYCCPLFSGEAFPRHKVQPWIFVFQAQNHKLECRHSVCSLLDGSFANLTVKNSQSGGGVVLVKENYEAELSHMQSRGETMLIHCCPLFSGEAFPRHKVQPWIFVFQAQNHKLECRHSVCSLLDGSFANLTVKNSQSIPTLTLSGGRAGQTPTTTIDDMLAKRQETHPPKKPRLT